MTLSGIPGVADGAALTASRTTYDVGLPGLAGRLPFATYGDPAFEAVLRHIETVPLPTCVRRLQVEIPELAASVAGYAVTVCDGTGQTAARLVTSWSDLAGLSLEAEVCLAEKDVEPLRQDLSAMARQEYVLTQVVPRIEALNEAAGRSQHLLAHLVARGLLRSRLQTGAAETLFWREIQSLESICQGRQQVRVRHIPTALGQRLSGLLFELELPSLGEEGPAATPVRRPRCRLSGSGQHESPTRRSVHCRRHGPERARHRVPGA